VPTFLCASFALALPLVIHLHVWSACCSVVTVVWAALAVAPPKPPQLDKIGKSQT
jgi:hypothetical protein